MIKQKKQAIASFAKGGFSLLEVSIMLGVLSVVLAGLLPFITESMRDADEKLTKERLEWVEKALAAYYEVNASLPCPAPATVSVRSSDFGVAANHDGGSPGSCIDSTAPDATAETDTGISGVPAVSYGAVPTRALGLPDEYGVDGYGRYFSYFVSLDVVAGGTTGTIVVQDAFGTERLNDAAYALLSHGENGHGGYSSGGVRLGKNSISTLEQENCDCQANGSERASPDDFDERGHILVGAMPSRNPGTAQHYDDMLRYKSVALMDAMIAD